MKKLLTRICLFVAVLFLSVIALKAHPYASGVTNNAGNIQFILNESGGNVTVVYEDGTTNANFDGATTGTNLTRGSYSFPLGAHTSYSISVTKIGNGTPAQISVDSDQWAIYANGKGVAVNKNPKSTAFGRIYAGSSGTGGFAYGTPGFKPQGVFYFNADFSSGARGTNQATPTGQTFGSSGPWRMRVAPDDSLLVGDFSGSGSLYAFAPDLNSSANIFLAAQPAGIHGDGFGTPMATGSLATGDLTLWIPDSGMAVPATVPVLGPNTHYGDFNCVYRYDIGAGPIPATGWTNHPNYAYTVGLSSIAELRPEVDIAPNGNIIAGFGRANLSNPDIQILSPDGLTPLWDSWNDTAGASDPWNGANGSGSQVGMYAGVRVSPDGRFLASVDQVNGITIALLTNGIPDDSTIFGIKNTPAGSASFPARGMDWDAADNIYVMDSISPFVMRVFSLGITTTCVTTNDSTGTNGFFQLIVPSLSASVAATTPTASQNYINNTPAGTPTPGVFRITLTTNSLAGPVVVNYSLSGSAVNGVNYTINTGDNGVVITPTTVTFPQGNFPGAGNWSQDIIVTPTATPVIGPTLTATIRITGGATYTAVAPLVANISILNTGPQLLVMSAVASGATMNRAVVNDYAKFVITRLGDLNGPGNSAGNVTATPYTVTNFTVTGTAAPFPADYTAGPQNLPNSGVPTDGSPGILISPGVAVFTNLVGNPVLHTDPTIPPTNVTIILNLTNSVPPGTDLLSAEGKPYTVSNINITLTELDNTVGPEEVLWSNPLTNALDSTNWTLTFASTNLGATTVLPVVITNYDQNNLPPSVIGGGSNNFEVTFGSPVASYGVPQSPVMAANGWDTALRMTVNKDFSFAAPAGVNLYPQGQNFHGNYALRFSMYLSMYADAIDNTAPGTFPNEFALFGINHHGTNCNWKPTTPVTATTGGSGMTNSDGIWMAIDAGAGSAAPADYDGFAPFPLPNNGIPGTGVANGEPVSSPASGQAGIFKRPPFAGANTAAQRLGGSPINKWVDVSVEVTRQTNISLFINRSQVLTSYASTNGNTNGTIMLGYLDPVKDVSDGASAFVYYSNVRVVKLSPFMTIQPVSLIVTQGTSVSFTNAAIYGTAAPITNIWYAGTATAAVTPLQTNIFNATEATNVLSLANVVAANATNYYGVWSDSSGSVTSVVATLEVVPQPANVVSNAGTIAKITVAAKGPAAPTSFQWKTNNVNLVNNSHISGATATVLVITNAQAADARTYTCVVGNASGSVTVSGTLTIVNPASSAVVSPAIQTNLWGSTATFTVSASGTSPFTYKWKTNGVNLANGSHYSGATSSTLTISNITTLDATAYTVGVSNSAGGVLSSPGTLAVFIPAPTLSNVSVGGGNAVISFNSTNIYDTTNAFVLQSSTVVEGPYTNTPASFTTSGGGNFQVTAPQNGDNVFYRLMHNN